MDKLLEAILESHGGAKNWARTTKIEARMSLGGPFWAARGWPNVCDEQTVALEPHRERIAFVPFPKAGLRSAFDVGPERVSITDAKGDVVEERIHVRDTFPLPFDLANTPWDALQLAYFASAAMWNYLTAPFVFSYAGVEVQEIAPWGEGEETWRRLAVRFPRTNANHNPEQVFYYDDRLMLRRMDYAPEVTGSPPVAHYCHDHRMFNGFVFPTRRRVYLRDANGVADQSFAPITIDISTIAVATQ